MSASTFVVPDLSTQTPADVTVNFDRIETAVAAVIDQARAGRGFCFFTLNLDHLVNLKTDERFKRAYRAADFVSADGWPVVWLLRRQGYLVERASGADLVEPLCARAAQCGIGVYLVGPRRESQERAAAILRARYPMLEILGAETPDLPHLSSDEAIEDLAERIRASGARLCFLSLGSPKQEILAAALVRLCPEVGFVGVGAAIDFISRHAIRAPLFMQRHGLEWLWRAVGDPKRLGLRYLRCSKFFVSVLWWSLYDRRVFSIVHGAKTLPLGGKDRLTA